MVSHIAQQLNADAPAKELHVKIVDYVLTTENDLPSTIALNLINDEAKRVLSFGAQESI